MARPKRWPHPAPGCQSDSWGRYSQWVAECVLRQDRKYFGTAPQQLPWPRAALGKRAGAGPFHRLRFPTAPVLGRGPASQACPLTYSRAPTGGSQAYGGRRWPKCRPSSPHPTADTGFSVTRRLLFRSHYPRPCRSLSAGPSLAGQAARSGAPPLRRLLAGEAGPVGGGSERRARIKGSRHPPHSPHLRGTWGPRSLAHSGAVLRRCHLSLPGLRHPAKQSRIILSPSGRAPLPAQEPSTAPSAQLVPAAHVGQAWRAKTPESCGPTRERRAPDRKNPTGRARWSLSCERIAPTVEAGAGSQAGGAHGQA